MTANFRTLVVLAFCLASFTFSPAQDAMTFNVRGGNPGGVGGYTGEVTLTKLGESTAKVRWVAGVKKEVTEGIAVKTENAIGTAYGGQALYALAVYELKGNRIRATWTMAAKPKESGTYELKGADFEGALPFADGTPGSVTFTPGKGGVFKVVWDLQSGRYEGIGLRIGDALVAASGDVNAGFGIGAYAPKGDDIEGMWATTQSQAPGTEKWSLPDGGGEVAGNGKTVEFAGETYELKENKSAPGQVNSELREYLRKGEDWEGYRKMVALRMQNVKTDAAGLAKSTLEQVQKKHPNSYVKEIEMEEGTATIFFILVTGDDVELNLFRYQQGKGGIASAQFVMRNKPPYDTQKKFKAEQDKQWDKWVEEITALGGKAAALMAATAGQGIPDAAPAAKTGKDEIPPELVKAIKVDMDKCVAIAQKFMGHIQAGETEKAVGLMGDAAFTKVSRADFTKAVEKYNGVFGALKSYKPDKDATDFGVKEGVMTFTLQADAEYANAKVRETLKFIRNDQGGVEFIGYNRNAKE